MRTEPTARQGFSLLETLVVIVIVAVLAVFVMPEFAAAKTDSRDEQLRDDVRDLREQIRLYRAEHGGLTPGMTADGRVTTGSAAMMFDQLMRYTDDAGHTSPTIDSRYPHGPYLADFPVNAVVGNNRVRIVPPGRPLPRTAVGGEGWVYQPSTGRLRVNAWGRDSRGVRYLDY